MSRKLLFSTTIHDCRVDYIAATHGAGGQNKNRRHTAVRITHEPSGVTTFSADENNQLRNKIDAFRKLGEHPQFQAWARRVAQEITTGKSLEERVEEEMTPEKLKLEVHDSSGRWVEVKEIDAE